ncbi:MAG: 30S ribosomal protein S7, partial [Synergistaceae bacterium]|nr:30S ribosomal protein S7 [Synergistaceae bacterium]
MPRKGHIKKRPSVPDIRFNNPAASRFISALMKGGKRSLAEKIF